MKKLLFVILLCFDFIAFDQAKTFHHAQAVESFQKMHLQSGYFSEEISFSKIADGYNNHTFYLKLSKLAEKSGVSLFVYPSADDALVYSYISDKALFHKLALNGNALTAFNKSDQKYHSSKYIGEIYPLSKIKSNTFNSLLMITEKKGSDGIDRFCTLMDSAFPQFREGYEYVRFPETTTYGNIREGNHQQMKDDCLSAYLFMSILSLVTVCMTVLIRLKAYGVKKLQGYSNATLYLDDLSDLILLSCITFSIVGIVQFVIHPFPISLWLWFFIFHGFLLLIMMFILLLNHVFLAIQKIPSLLSGKISLSIYMTVNTIMKIIISAALMMVFYEAASFLAVQFPYMMQRDQYIDTYKHYISFELNEEASDSETLNHIYMLLKKPYKVYYWERYISNSSDQAIPILKTNKQFLEAQGIRDIHHKKIALPQADDDVFVGIADHYTELIRNLNPAELCASGSNMDFNQQTVYVDCHYARLKNDQTLNTFFPVTDSAHMQIKTPVITTQIGSVNDDTMFIDTSLPGNQKADILKTLAQSKIPASDYKVVDYEEVYDHITDSNPEIFMFYVKRILLVSALLIFIIIQMITMYMKMDRKKIFVNVLLGTPDFRIFYKFLLVELSGGILSAILMLQFIKWQRGSQYQIDNMYWWIVFVYMLTESVCLFIALRKMKYKNVQKQLKGDD